MNLNKKWVAFFILLFLGIVLPLSLVLLGKSTEMRRRAAGEIPPISVPTTPEPTPSTFPTPSVRPSPSVTPPPTLNYEDIQIDGSSITRTIDGSSAQYGAGHAIGFRFQVTTSMRVETLAKELDLATNGSYIDTHLFDSQFNLVQDGSTRTENNLDPGTYYLVVHTWVSSAVGRAQVQVWNQETEKIRFATRTTGLQNTINIPMNNINSYMYVNRQPVYMEIKFPSEITLSDDAVSFYSRISGGNITLHPKVAQSCIPDLWTRQQQNFTTVFNNQPGIFIEKSDSNTVKIQKKVNDSGVDFDRGRYYLLGLMVTDSTGNIFGNNGTSGIGTFSYNGKRSDFDSDGIADLSDYAILLSEFLRPIPTPQADATCDNFVDLEDYAILVQEFLH